jgi:lipoprotein-releasing system permease protein
MALFVVLGFVGWKNYLSFSNDLDPDLKVFPKVGVPFFLSEVQSKELQKIEGLANYSQINIERFIYFGWKEQVTIWVEW